jgi:hypothetical protein
MNKVFFRLYVVLWSILGIGLSDATQGKFLDFSSLGALIDTDSEEKNKKYSSHRSEISIDNFCEKFLKKYVSGNLEVLSLSDNRLGSNAFKKITNCFLSKEQICFPNLKILDISSNDIDENSAFYIQCWINSFPNLFIDINDTSISLKNIIKLSKALGVQQEKNLQEPLSIFKLKNSSQIVFQCRSVLKKEENLIPVEEPLQETIPISDDAVLDYNRSQVKNELLHLLDPIAQSKLLHLHSKQWLKIKYEEWSETVDTFFNAIDDALLEIPKIFSLESQKNDFKEEVFIKEIREIKLPNLQNDQNKKLGLLIQEMRTDAIKTILKKEALHYIKNVIFMRKDYVNKASKEVKIYKTFVEDFYLPQDWDKIHKEYYSLKLLKEFYKFRETVHFANWLDSPLKSENHKDFLDMQTIKNEINNLNE